LNFLSDVITYVRRLIKTPSNASISDNLIIDYINRFWIMDVDARLQLFDLKTKYQFQTTPGIDQYNMPLYDVQTEQGAQNIGMYPVYQGFEGPAFINGIQVPFYTQRSAFFNLWPNYVQSLTTAAVGDGTAGPYTIYMANSPVVPGSPNPQPSGILAGHVDMAGIIATGMNVDPPLSTVFNTSIPVTSVNPAITITSTDAMGANVIVTDSGQFLASNQNYGLLMSPGTAPFGNASLGAYSTTSNTINYQTGVAIVTFPVSIPVGMNIQSQCYFWETGLPRAILFYNNVITLRTVPNTQYLVELDAYLSPAAFLTTSAALQFAYMAEYIARGAARKILSDTGDIEQFQFYEPLFREQEMLVWKRSQRQFTATRTATLFSQGQGNQGNWTGGTQSSA